MRDLFAAISNIKRKKTSIPNSNSKSKHSSYNPHQSSPKNLKEKKKKGICIKKKRKKKKKGGKKKEKP